MNEVVLKELAWRGRLPLLYCLGCSFGPVSGALLMGVFLPSVMKSIFEPNCRSVRHVPWNPADFRSVFWFFAVCLVPGFGWVLSCIELQMFPFEPRTWEVALYNLCLYPAAGAIALLLAYNPLPVTAFTKSLVRNAVLFSVAAILLSLRPVWEIIPLPLVIFLGIGAAVVSWVTLPGKLAEFGRVEIEEENQPLVLTDLRRWFTDRAVLRDAWQVAGVALGGLVGALLVGADEGLVLGGALGLTVAAAFAQEQYLERLRIFKVTPQPKNGLIGAALSPCFIHTVAVGLPVTVFLLYTGGRGAAPLALSVMPAQFVILVSYVGWRLHGIHALVAAPLAAALPMFIVYLVDSSPIAGWVLLLLVGGLAFILVNHAIAVSSAAYRFVPFVVEPYRKAEGR